MKRITETSDDSSFGFLSNKKARASKPQTAKKYTKRDEDRILKFALKQSELEFKQSQDKKSLCDLKYSDIPQCKTVVATEQDFQNPILFFESLWEKDQHSTGVIKVIPPDSWKRRYKGTSESYVKKFEESDRKLDTRRMNLNKLYMAKKFEYTKTFNFSEYRQRAHNYSNKIYQNFDKTPLEKIEADYWRRCFSIEDSAENEVDYAADVPLKNYLSKQEISNASKENCGKDWNLLSLNSQRNSLFQFVKNDTDAQISGVTIPWLYFGMLYSTFCWHTEDLYLYSINYLHEGKPKVWYSIPHTQKEKMDEYIKNKYYAILIKQPDLIHFLTVFIDPLELMRNGIEVYKAVQNPGEIVITLPEGYHSGFNSGFNIAEAVNFSTLKWIDFGFKAITDYRRSKTKMPVFSLEWLIFHNLANLHNINFDKTLHFQEVYILLKKFNYYLKKIVNDELENRRLIEANFIGLQINYNIIEIEDSSKYDEHECPFCRNYCYLSYLKCRSCNRKCCITHNIQCQCLPTDFILGYRFKQNVRTS